MSASQPSSFESPRSALATSSRHGRSKVVRIAAASSAGLGPPPANAALLDKPERLQRTTAAARSLPDFEETGPTSPQLFLSSVSTVSPTGVGESTSHLNETQVPTLGVSPAPSPRLMQRHKKQLALLELAGRHAVADYPTLDSRPRHTLPRDSTLSVSLSAPSPSPSPRGVLRNSVTAPRGSSASLAPPRRLPSRVVRLSCDTASPAPASQKRSEAAVLLVASPSSAGSPATTATGETPLGQKRAEPGWEPDPPDSDRKSVKFYYSEMLLPEDLFSATFVAQVSARIPADWKKDDDYVWGFFEAVVHNCRRIFGRAVSSPLFSSNRKLPASSRPPSRFTRNYLLKLDRAFLRSVDDCTAKLDKPDKRPPMLHLLLWYANCKRFELLLRSAEQGLTIAAARAHGPPSNSSVGPNSTVTDQDRRAQFKSVAALFDHLSSATSKTPGCLRAVLRWVRCEHRI
eukprot:Gregarina_sp_Pseudo_9__3235@NODE_341_length_3107_cov_29_969687_g321_i0_p1_GENE_NODE_341_length_3107_cov_29_969687_g321_i0NODE_341_length_3107_cov_29_969687_g321_i0_p1_ORF_typecomplete_len459_score102_40_NODE_341_length_3107_cov_29_969687_g321_i014132789